MEKERKYTYKECVLAYLDILGFKNKVYESEEHPEEIKPLVKALKINQSFADANSKGRKGVDFRGFFFSDSFVFIVKKDVRAIPHLFLVIRYLQDRLWEKELCLRGAVVLGKQYWPKNNENIILGPAMIDAYKLESNKVKYPRIMIEGELVNTIQKGEVLANPLSREGMLIDFIKRDDDGIYFFDILDPKITRKKNEKIANNDGNLRISWDPHGEDNYEDLVNHLKEFVDKKLKDRKIISNAEVKQKYEWLQTYIDSVRGEK